MVQETLFPWFSLEHDCYFVYPASGQIVIGVEVSGAVWYPRYLRCCCEFLDKIYRILFERYVGFTDPRAGDKFSDTDARIL